MQLKSEKLRAPPASLPTGRGNRLLYQFCSQEIFLSFKLKTSACCVFSTLYADVKEPRVRVPLPAPPFLERGDRSFWGKPETALVRGAKPAEGVRPEWWVRQDLNL